MSTCIETLKNGRRTMGTLRFYDSLRGRLIDVHGDAAAMQRYWDSHWARVAGDSFRAAVHTPNAMVMRVTKRYLPTGSFILEGGCGLGQNVWGLEKIGYKVCGVDNAERTLDMVRSIEPSLDLRNGDVRSLNFPDASFDGYWSLGVIEHFWSGYDEIISEMARVLKPGGLLFLTFPTMNPLRRVRAERGLYPDWSPGILEEYASRFYQFLLPLEEVEADLHKKGFESIEIRLLDGYKGAKDELPWVATLGRVFGWFGLGRVWKKALNASACKRCGHIAMLVMRKNPEK